MKWIRVIILLLIFILICVFQSYACSITTVPLNFGNYEKNIPSESTGSVGITCSPGTAFTVMLSSGQYSGSSYYPRKMSLSGGADMLNYNLYRNSALTEIWGDGTGNTFIQMGVGTGTETIFRVYGRIPAGQNVRSGTYNDSITVTVEW